MTMHIQTLIVIVLSTTFCQAECPIECYCDRITTCTGDKLLTQFPIKIHVPDSSSQSQQQQLPMLRLELHDYAVKHLSRQDLLQIISNLTEISISRNSLETFDQETFVLELLTAAGTTRDRSRDQQMNTESGTSASGRRRSFSQLSPDSSNAILKLRILDLSQNKLKYFFGGGKLSKLKILDLSANMLEEVSGLTGMVALESINFRQNKLRRLEPDIFQNLRNLQYVNLDSNLLEVIDPSIFSNLPSLAHLILSSNPISNLQPGFYWNSRVQFVDVSNVGLTSIPPSLTKTVRDFRCANNNLSSIKQTDFESYPLVGLLVLDENKIEEIEDDTFGRLDFLSRLWINGNKLRKVPQNLPPSLRSLQLEDNRISNISSGDFKNLKNLQELNLHSNRISSLPPFVFAELTGLKSLDLRSNLIDVIYADSLANLSKLETLDIAQNPIKTIVSGAFENVRRVTLLHLSRLMEPIEMDVRCFRPLQNVQILELDDSPHLTLKMFQDGAFSYFPNIFELNIQRCELEDINLVSNALVELNPQTIKMNENPWDCEDLQGSAIHELMSRMVVVDQPTCTHPQKLHGIQISSLNITNMPKASFSVFQNGGGSDADADGDTSEEEEKTPMTRGGESSQNPEHYFTSPLSPDSDVNSHHQHATHSNNQTLQNTNSHENDTHVIIANSGSGQALSEFTNNSSTTLVLMTKSNFSSSVKSASGPGSSAARSTSSSQAQAPGHGDYEDEDDDASDRLDGRSQASSKTRGGGSAGGHMRNKEVETNTFSDFLDGDGVGGGSVLPTQSYFDYPTTHVDMDVGKSDVRDNSNSVSGRSGGPGQSHSIAIASSSRGNKMGTNSISSNHDRKPPSPAPHPNSIPIYKNKNNATSSSSSSSGPGAGRSWGETKTNDDNTIIDESESSGRERESSAGSTKLQGAGDASSTAQRSIDGFPLAYPDNDRVAKEAPSPHEGNKGSGGSNNPKYSYLKDNTKALKRSRNNLPYDDEEDSSAHMAVIVKTLVISALTCLGSILSLFFISVAVYRYTYRRRVMFPCTRRRCSNEEGEDREEHQGAGMMYKRFGRRDSSHGSGNGSCSIISTSSHYRHHHQGESDSDQVELSGITNSLYFENEDIYHIT